MDLFSMKREQELRQNAPLAQRMRARTLDEFVGQEHLMKPGKILPRMIQADRLTSMILYGPPGTGKTTLAHIIAQTTRKRFVELSAVTSGVKDIRETVSAAQDALGVSGQGTVVFIDEIHRFNKSQQDALLPHVERGVLTLIGATTENPYFEVNKALLSRCQIFRLEPLKPQALEQLVKNALEDRERGLGNMRIQLTDDGLHYLVAVAQSDGRNLLNILELAALTTLPASDGTITITAETIKESSQTRRVRYDKGGEQHYDMISAMIKSMRGSDPNAALHWLAAMLEGGEDPKFIARRIIIAASEDVGNADPMALPLAMAAFQAVDTVGMPEGRIPLAQAVVYLALAPKSNASYVAINKAMEAVRNQGTGLVPEHLKNIKVETQDETMDHGAYRYPHDYPGHYVPQTYLPEDRLDTNYYTPGSLGGEGELVKRWKRRLAGDEKADFD